MRADRLVAALLLMQARGSVTASELATELEVSVATARRDLQALSSAGIPVYPQAGRGGGWSLIGGARTDLSGLTAGEAQALFLLAGPATSVTPELRSALRKLMRALPGTFRSAAQAAAQAVVIDPVRWGEAPRVASCVVRQLRSAVVDRRKVRLAYEDRAGRHSERLVDPLGLVDKDDVWYLIAQTDNGERTFRVDRVVRVETTDIAAVRPAEFDLAAAWGRVVDAVERDRGRTSARIEVDERFLPVLRAQFGRHLTVTSSRGKRVRLRVSAPTPLTIAEQLAGWGATVDVLEPAEVRAELARIGAELVGRYGRVAGVARLT